MDPWVEVSVCECCVALIAYGHCERDGAECLSLPGFRAYPEELTSGMSDEDQRFSWGTCDVCQGVAGTRYQAFSREHKVTDDPLLDLIDQKESAKPVATQGIPDRRHQVIVTVTVEFDFTEADLSGGPDVWLTGEPRVTGDRVTYRSQPEDYRLTATMADVVASRLRGLRFD